MNRCIEPLHTAPLDLTKAVWFVRDIVDMDALSRKGVNAVCLPTEATWDELDGKCLANARSVVIASPDGAWRKEAVDELGHIIPGVPRVEIETGYGDARNMAGFAAKHGENGLYNLLRTGREVPACGIINLASVKWTPPRYVALSKIPSLDKAIGGFGEGELSVWTGHRGDGKSTLISQLLLNAIDQGANVFVFSGELKPVTFKSWMLAQAAGPTNVVSKEDPQTGNKYWFASKGIEYNIDRWISERLYIHDLEVRDAFNPDWLLSTMRAARRFYDCSVFLVDNLMALNLPGRDKYQAQSEFVGRLVAFAKQTGAHVHLVAHPRKTGGEGFTSDDISGSGDIANRADNVFRIRRLCDEEAAKRNAPVELSLLKNRAHGVRDNYGLFYEPKSRRFAGIGQSFDWKYGWETFTECEEPTPFDDFKEV